MCIAYPSLSSLAQASAALIRKGPKVMRSPVIRADRDALAFSAKTFTAAMLAYYIALRIGLPKPYWAILTVYIVSQGSAGASLGRGVYRLCGTIIGAAATVAIVPNFANEPVLCSLILSCWIGLCLYFSLLDRTPRAYAFVLAGYTASLIGFPGVADPGAMFDTAAVRVQEILLGIGCAVLIHRFILPRPMTGQFTGKLSATLKDARGLAREALKGLPDVQGRHARAALASDLLALNGLATHLPYDAATVAAPRKALDRVHDLLARLIPLSTEIEDRLHALHPLSDAEADMHCLLYDIDHWLRAGTPSSDELVERARRHGASGLATNLCGHLAELIELLDTCDRLGAQIVDGARRQRDYSPDAHPTGYVYHRDRWMAVRGAMGAIAGIFAGCLLWIWSALADGALALSIVGVACALFGNFDAPRPFVIKYLIGSLYAVAISLAYSFVILPRVSDFPVLVAVLAPTLLLAGSMQARPPTTMLALGITLSFPILTGLGASYTGDFAVFLNSTVALVIGTGFAAVSMTLFQTVPVKTAIDRLLCASRRDVARRARGHAMDEARWTSIMIDRTALLIPRAKAAGKVHLPDTILMHLRVGHAVGALRHRISDRPDQPCEALHTLLAGIGQAFSESDEPEHEALIAQVDAAATRIADSAADDVGEIADRLIDLRFALMPVNAGGSR